MHTIKNILKISIPLYIVHAVEEYSTGLLKIDPVFRWVEARGFNVATFYVVEQFLLIGLILWAIHRPKQLALFIIGLIFIFEITHVIPAVQHVSYYPGLITAIPLLIIGCFYWKKLLSISSAK